MSFEVLSPPPPPRLTTVGRSLFGRSNGSTSCCRLTLIRPLDALVGAVLPIKPCAEQYACGGGSGPTSDRKHRSASKKNKRSEAHTTLCVWGGMELSSPREPVKIKPKSRIPAPRSRPRWHRAHRAPGQRRACGTPRRPRPSRPTVSCPAPPTETTPRRSSRTTHPARPPFRWLRRNDGNRPKISTANENVYYPDGSICNGSRRSNGITGAQT